MVDNTSKKTSRIWPYLKTAAKAVRIPGTDLTLGALADLQDELSAEEAQKETRVALEKLNADVSKMARILSEFGVQVYEHDISEVASELAEGAYLKYVASQYLYSDFKGIEQLEKLVPLKLDDVFVSLSIRREDSYSKRSGHEAELFDHLLAAEGGDRDKAEQRLAEFDLATLRSRHLSSTRETIDAVLKPPGGTVLLGGPGSGKTTLVKRLARSFALGNDKASERYPELPWCFPVVIPMTLYDERSGGCTIYEFVKSVLEKLGGRALVLAFEKRWKLGMGIILLDGLDEVADAGRRISCARAAGDLVTSIGGNRVLITSRPVGYSICRLSVPADHVMLETFGVKDITAFVHQWHVAYDRAVHPERPDPKSARNAAEQLITDIRSNPRVESLAANPLMLTIIALIKQQNVGLPERRVGLYEIALNTLIRSWNKARSLSNQPIGESLSAEETKKVWAAVAFWMHKESRAGTVHASRLHQKLVDILLDFDYPELQADQTAESYIRTAAERSGLLEERGANNFSFMHQTFQEYLAARHLWLSRPRSEAIKRILEVSYDPRWHEVIRLAAGFVGVIQEDDEMVTELVEAILDEQDPLEVYLCSSLRLAASCVSDDVRVMPRVTRKVVKAISERLRSAPYDTLARSLVGCLEGIHCYQPDLATLDALRNMSEHSLWKVRREAARMLSQAVSILPQAVEILRNLLEDSTLEVRAYAALGLWRAGKRSQFLARDMLLGFSGAEFGRLPIAELKLESWLEELMADDDENVRLNAASILGNQSQKKGSTVVLFQLLEHDIPLIRLRAAEILGEMGYDVEVTPVVVKLLEHRGALIRSWAAKLLINWDIQTELSPEIDKLLFKDTVAGLRIVEAFGPRIRMKATPILRKFLCHRNDFVRLDAAKVLGNWYRDQEVSSVLLELTESPYEMVRLRASGLLEKWGRRAVVAPVLLRLLESKNPGVRYGAASTLGDWGDKDEAIPVMRKLLESEDADLLYSAASTLCKWGHEAVVSPVLARLLESEDAYIRKRSVEALGSWGRSGEVSRKEVLGALLEDFEAVADYFDHNEPGKPNPEVSRLLARALKRRQGDSEPIELRRQIIFQWIWQAAQQSE